MVRETYTPTELEDGTLDHGVFYHRKTALTARILEKGGITTLHHPITGELLEEPTKKFSWLEEEGLQDE